jgi:hypothetical protein
MSSMVFAGFYLKSSGIEFHDLPYGSTHEWRIGSFVVCYLTMPRSSCFFTGVVKENWLV